MRTFAKPAVDMVDTMRQAAATDPQRAVAFGGAPGSNSHQATMQFDPECLPLPYLGFEDALDAVKQGRAGCAMIPIENSQHGRVSDIHFLLPESGLSIVAEHFMRITHALMATGPGPFEAAYSHPQALGQSREYLQKNGIIALAHADTAGAAAYVAEMRDPKFCALAPPMAAELYGLDIIENAVEDAADNTTRFVAVQRGEQAVTPVGPCKTSVVMSLEHEQGALYRALGLLMEHGLNLTKLESRPTSRAWRYHFYLDFVGTGVPDAALDALAANTPWMKHLGTYPAAERPVARVAG